MFWSWSLTIWNATSSSQRCTRKSAPDWCTQDVVFRNQVLAASPNPSACSSLSQNSEDTVLSSTRLREVKSLSCLNPECLWHRKVDSGSIIRHGFYRTRSGKRRRYRCVGCGKTFSSTKGTPYYRLQHRRATFDAVVALRVEGVSIAAIARVEGIAWNTVARWLERAAQVCRRFNHGRITGFVVEELQADEIRSFTSNKKRQTWVFVAIEVWSRLWASTVVGRRSYRNTLALLGDVSNRMDFGRLPLIVTDGFDFYERVVRRVFGPACLYGQVLKTRRNDRIVKVERRALVGTARRLEEALNNSEDSSTLNTSFIERLNLTIRQGSAYLRRRSPCHARCADQLREHVELLRCHYNFVRRHGALKFGRETRTPAMQAGLVSRRLTLSDIFTARGLSLRLFVAVVRVFATDQPTETDAATLPTFSWPPRSKNGRLINSEWRKHPLPPEVETKVGTVEGVTSVKVEVVWEPTWTPEEMTEAARLQLGMF